LKRTVPGVSGKRSIKKTSEKGSGNLVRGPGDSGEGGKKRLALFLRGGSGTLKKHINLRDADGGKSQRGCLGDKGRPALELSTVVFQGGESASGQEK